jgi:hypothetical protein
MTALGLKVREWQGRYQIALVPRVRAVDEAIR